MTEQFTTTELEALRSLLSTISGLTPLGQLAVDALVEKTNLILSFHTPVEHVAPKPGISAV